MFLSIFEEINDFVDKYKNPPTKPALEIEIDKRKDLSEVEHKKVLELLSSLEDSKVEYDWLVDTVEKFCKDKAIYNAIVEGINIIDGKDRVFFAARDHCIYHVENLTCLDRKDESLHLSQTLLDGVSPQKTLYA